MLSTEETATRIVKLAAGESHRDIAKASGVSRSAISQFAKENREQIDRLRAEKLDSLAGKALNLIKNDLLIAATLQSHIADPQNAENPTALQDNKDILAYLKIIDGTRTNLLKANGLFAVHDKAPALVQINNTQINQVYNKETEDYIKWLKYQKPLESDTELTEQT